MDALWAVVSLLWACADIDEASPATRAKILHWDEDEPRLLVLVEGEALFLYQSVCFLGTELIYLEQYEPRQLLWSIWKSYSSAPMSHLAAVPLGSEFATKCDEKHGPFITVNRVPMSGRKWSVVQVRTLCPCQEPRGVALLGFWSELLLLCKIECHSFSLSLDLITRQ